MRGMRGRAAGAVLALTAALAGCGGYGWEDVLHDGMGGWGSDVRGQVQDVHERYRTIVLRRDDGRRVDVRYDSRTDVVYGDRRYRPESLDRGDYVSMRVDRDRRGQLFARHIVVRRSARDRDVYRDRDRDRDRNSRDDDHRYDARTAEGRVERVDRREGRFQLRTGGRTVWVTVPYNAGRGVRERLSRLREGDYVRLQGRWRGRDRFELERFR